MIRIPHDDIVKKIKESTDLTEEQINEKIEAKLKQLGGLISKDGAAHIISNELGVKLIASEDRKKVKDIYAGMRNIELLAKVQTIFEGREFSRTDGTKGKVGSIIVADETGSIRIVCWGDHADMLPKLSKDDLLLIKSGYSRDSNRGYKEIHLNDNSKITANPPDETLGDVASSDFGARPKAQRKKIKELMENDENIEVLGTIVQIFDPKYFEVCPQCKKRIKPRDGVFTCNLHGETKPDYSCLLNVFLDDGSDNIRVTFFQNQTEILTKRNREELDAYRQMPEKFDEVKTELLGNIVKLIGRARQNTFFNRLEFTANLVFLDPNPEEELKNLN